MKKRIVAALGAAAFLAALSVLLIWNHKPASPRGERARGEARSGALAALDAWSAARAYPDLDIPPDKYYKAYRYTEAQFKTRSRRLQSSNVWEPIGPTNLSGRTLSAAVNPMNPSTLYIGTASGGLWVSYSAGLEKDWGQVRLGYPALGISSIVIDPTDTNTIYIGTGEVYRYRAAAGGLVWRTTRGSYGIGILKTTDGGVTWTKSLDWSESQERGIEKVLMNPKNHNSLWATTTEGVYRSTNAGGSWQLSLNVLMGEDIVIHTIDTSMMIASCGNFLSSGHGMYRTYNAGATWTPIDTLATSSGKTMLGIYASNPDIVYASVADSTTGVGALYRSLDFGSFWELLQTNDIDWGVQGWYSHYIAVHPTDVNLLAHAGVSMSFSTDGGARFMGSSGTYSDHHGFAIDPSNPHVLYDANDDGIYRSTDFGNTFLKIGDGLQTGQLYNGFSCSMADSNVALTQSQDHIPGYIYWGGMIWGTSANDEAGWTAIDPSNDYIMYAVSRNGQAVWKSANRGGYFNFSGSFSGNGAWNSPILVSRSTPSVLYFGEIRVFKSTNAGSSWSATNGNFPLDGNTTLVMAMSAKTTDTVYAGTAPYVTAPHVFRTTNGGGTWTNITGTLPNRYPLDLAVDPRDAAIVYIAYGGFGTGHVFKSTDAGTTWNDITGTLPDVPASALAIDPFQPENVYAGNDLGVWCSTDGGSSWNAFSDGLPDAVIVADLVVSPSNRSLKAATHGNGAYERKLYDGTPPLSFDYKALSVIYPSASVVVFAGSGISGMKGMFRNQTSQARPDSFDVKFRILSGPTEVFSSLKRIRGLKATEVREVIFDGTYIAPAPGTYTTQIISLASDQVPRNDTSASYFTAQAPPTIATYKVNKVYSPYSEITGGTYGPYGDDMQLVSALPFPFTFDGYAYDSMQVSTNGWIEFGQGFRGYERGISTPQQLGPDSYVPNTILGTTERPTKTLAPWWDDLITDETSPTGVVMYKTLGSAPKRVFVIQYRHIRAHYEDSVTTYLNFQVRLYEVNNVLEFCYGPLERGYMTGAGAVMGMKDYLGGDYHYYDLVLRRIGAADELKEDLDPLRDWPGADSCYRIIPQGVQEVPEPRHELPVEFALGQNYPNPFNPSTAITFTLPRISRVRLAVYDILGRELHVVTDGRMEAGYHEVRFDASGLPSGIYFYRMDAGAFRAVKKMVLVR